MQPRAIRHPPSLGRRSAACGPAEVMARPSSGTSHVASATLLRRRHAKGLRRTAGTTPRATQAQSGARSPRSRLVDQVQKVRSVVRRRVLTTPVARADLHGVTIAGSTPVAPAVGTPVLGSPISPPAPDAALRQPRPPNLVYGGREFGARHRRRHDAAQPRERGAAVREPRGPQPCDRARPLA